MRVAPLAAILLSILVFIPTASVFADGPVDPDFAYGGRPYVFPSSVGTTDVRLPALAQDLQGHVISAGARRTPENSYLVTRLSLDSPVSLDLAFGSNGVAANPFGSLIDSGAVAVAIDHHNRIVTAGYFTLYRNCGSSFGVPTNYFSAVRLKNGSVDDGQVDASFGTGFVSGTTGIAVGDCNFTYAPTALAIGEQDEVVVGGAAYNGTNDGIALVRWDASGMLDPSFGSGGVMTLYTSMDTELAAISIDRRGRIVVAAFQIGPIANKFWVYRFNKNGTLDGLFGIAGVTQIDMGAYSPICCIAIDPKNRIVVAGTYLGLLDNSAIVARLLEDGSVDSSFGISGISNVTPNGENSSVAGLALDRQGRPILAGSSGYGVATLMHLNFDGSLNSAVGFDGVFTTPLGLSVSTATGVKVDTLGRPIVSILGEDREGSVSAIVRYDELFGDGFD